jgi:hypothetical protein
LIYAGGIPPSDRNDWHFCQFSTQAERQIIESTHPRDRAGRTFPLFTLRAPFVSMIKAFGLDRRVEGLFRLPG